MSVSHRIGNPEIWRRFTLLDLLLLQACFGFGLALACSPGTGEAAGVERMIAGMVLGAVFAGPIILMTQWTLRGRSRPLSAGEWLWLTPTVLFLLLSCSLRFSPDFDLGSSSRLFVVWMFAQVTCTGVALATLFSSLRGYRSTVPCYWTDRLGSWASLLFGIWIFLAVLPGILLG
jgi:hypothetical protein